jgi:DNA-binding MarR family transcriptional regulator
MNVLVQSLERDGFVKRPSAAPVGKVLPTQLTPLGRRNLAKATVAVRSVEDRMLAGLDADSRTEARRILTSLITSLDPARRRP